MREKGASRKSRNPIHNSLSQMLKKDHTNLSWLFNSKKQWQEDHESKGVEEIVKKLCVVNDPAETAIKLDGDRICTIRLEKAI